MKDETLPQTLEENMCVSNTHTRTDTECKYTILSMHAKHINMCMHVRIQICLCTQTLQKYIKIQLVYT